MFSQIPLFTTKFASCFNINIKLEKFMFINYCTPLSVKTLAERLQESFFIANILQATLMAMRRAVMGLKIRPDYIAVDGNRLPQWEYRGEAVVKGDGRVEVISAASILAKVVRDQEMLEMDGKYPGYGFDSNKGYGTAQHLEALQRLGPTPIHRRSFAPVKDGLHLEQSPLF